MHKNELKTLYRRYIACLNNRYFDHLSKFVGNAVTHNGRALGLRGYREMLEDNIRAIPNLRFSIELLVVEPPITSSRLSFDCTPTGEFLGLPVNGRRVQFTENVFYEFADSRIQTVWSIIDQDAIRAQINA